MCDFMARAGRQDNCSPRGRGGKDHGPIPTIILTDANTTIGPAKGEVGKNPKKHITAWPLPASPDWLVVLPVCSGEEE